MTSGVASNARTPLTTQDTTAAARAMGRVLPPTAQGSSGRSSAPIDAGSAACVERHIGAIGRVGAPEVSTVERTVRFRRRQPTHGPLLALLAELRTARVPVVRFDLLTRR